VTGVADLPRTPLRIFAHSGDGRWSGEARLEPGATAVRVPVRTAELHATALRFLDPSGGPVPREASLLLTGRRYGLRAEVAIGPTGLAEVDLPEDEYRVRLIVNGRTQRPDARIAVPSDGPQVVPVFVPHVFRFVLDRTAARRTIGFRRARCFLVREGEEDLPLHPGSAGGTTSRMEIELIVPVPRGTIRIEYAGTVVVHEWDGSNDAPPVFAIP
jgi:hypothetical protein